MPLPLGTFAQHIFFCVAMCSKQFKRHKLLATNETKKQQQQPYEFRIEI